MKRSDILGQQAIVDGIIQAQKAGRMPHALLLTGPAGSGLLPVSLAIAQALMCNDGSFGDGTCEACKKVQRLVHPDLHFTYPLAGKDASSEQFMSIWRQALIDNPYLNIQDWMRLCGLEKKQPNINVKECHSIIHNLSLKPFEGDRKVYIIWGAEYLGREGNRLLKLIEEPPEGTFIMLITESVDAVLPTILSRCQLVKMTPLNDSDIAEGLIKQHDIHPDKARAIAHLADGDFNRALALAENEEVAIETIWSDWLTTVPKNDNTKKVEIAELLSQLSRDQQLLFLEYGNHFLAQVLHRKYDPGMELRLHENGVTLANRFAGFIDEQGISDLQGLLDEYVLYIRRNGNARILWMDLSIRANRLIKQIVKRRRQYA